MRMAFHKIKIPRYEKEKRIMIIGMPGIGNTGKIAIDYLIEVLKPQKAALFQTSSMPIFSYIDSNSLMKLPEIALYQKKIGKQRVFLLSGDYQPLNEELMFHFCNELLGLAKELRIKEIVCTGGIGLAVMPESPKIYSATATKMPRRIESLGAITKIHGHIATVAGVTGLLPIYAESYKIACYSLLVETIAFPDSISLKSTKNLLLFMNRAYDLRINLKRLDDEMKDNTRIAELEKVPRGALKDEVSYIG